MGTRNDEYVLQPPRWRVLVATEKGKLKRPERVYYGETTTLFGDYDSELEAWADVEARADELGHCTDVMVLPVRRVFLKF